MTFFLRNRNVPFPSTFFTHVLSTGTVSRQNDEAEHMTRYVETNSCVIEPFYYNSISPSHYIILLIINIIIYIIRTERERERERKRGRELDESTVPQTVPPYFI